MGLGCVSTCSRSQRACSAEAGAECGKMPLQPSSQPPIPIAAGLIAKREKKASPANASPSVARRPLLQSSSSSGVY